MKHEDQVKTLLPMLSGGELAQWLFAQGLSVIPVQPGTSVATLEVDQWLSGHLPSKIEQYWSTFPSDEVGIYVDKGLYVLTGIGEGACDVLLAIEAMYGTTPSVSVNTGEGCQHYFLLPHRISAQREAHVSSEGLGVICVDTGGCVVRAPGNPGMNIEKWNIARLRELAPVHQRFVDEVSMLGKRSWSFTHVEKAVRDLRQEPERAPVFAQSSVHAASGVTTVTIKVQLHTKPSSGFDDSPDPSKQVECEVTWS